MTVQNIKIFHRHAKPPKSHFFVRDRALFHDHDCEALITASVTERYALKPKEKNYLGFSLEAQSQKSSNDNTLACKDFILS